MITKTCQIKMHIHAYNKSRHKLNLSYSIHPEAYAQHEKTNSHPSSLSMPPSHGNSMALFNHYCSSYWIRQATFHLLFFFMACKNIRHFNICTFYHFILKCRDRESSKRFLTISNINFLPQLLATVHFRSKPAQPNSRSGRRSAFPAWVSKKGSLFQRKVSIIKNLYL